MAFLIIPLRFFLQDCEGAGPLKQVPDGPSKLLSRQSPRLDARHQIDMADCSIVLPNAIPFPMLR
jgi:hypothetical protein